MTLEQEDLVRNGPVTAFYVGYAQAVGDQIADVTVITKTPEGVRGCATRAVDMCKICVEHGFAKERNCGFPAT